MMEWLLSYFFPEIHPQERTKFMLLGLIAFTILSSYWLMWLLKQTIFFKIAFPEILGWPAHHGAFLQPLAKKWSPFVVLALVLLYSKLVDLVKKEQLFYIICSIYAVLFGAIGVLLCLKQQYGPMLLGKTLLASVGWIYFFAAESFGSLVIALFWSFANSVTDSDSAQRGFAFIVAAAQLGAMLGACIVLLTKTLGAVWPLVLVSSAMVGCIPAFVYVFSKKVVSNKQIDNQIEHKKNSKKDNFFMGFINGFTLLLTRPYLLGILIISTCGDIPLQIIEYLMQAQAALLPSYASEANFSWFQGMFGLATNGFSFLLALLITRLLIRKLGTKGSLLFYPVIFAITISLLFSSMWLLELQAHHTLWLIFITLIILKAIGYACNNPIKEVMYIPTSKDVKFKAKSWIDVFGSRFAKAGGAQVTDIYKANLEHLLFFGGIVSFGLIGVWITAAYLVGKKNKELTNTDRIIQ